MVPLLMLYVTAMWTGLMLLIYCSRPDIDPDGPHFLSPPLPEAPDRLRRAALTLPALADVSPLLAALRTRQVCRLHGTGTALSLLSFTAGSLC